MIARWLFAAARTRALEALADIGAHAVVAMLMPVRAAELERQNRLLRVQLQHADMEIERLRFVCARNDEMLAAQAVAGAFGVVRMGRVMS